MPGNFRGSGGGLFDEIRQDAGRSEKYTGGREKNQAGKAKNGEFAEKKEKKGALAQNEAGFLVKTS